MDCWFVGCLFSEHPSDEPGGRDSVVFDDAHKILCEMAGEAGIFCNSISAVPDTSESERHSNNTVDTEQNLPLALILNGNLHFGYEFPHLKIHIPSMYDNSFRILNQYTRAGFERWEFIHEIEEEQFIEGESTQLGNRFYFPHEILVDEFVLGVPLDAVVEAFGDGEDVEELDHSG